MRARCVSIALAALFVSASAGAQNLPPMPGSGPAPLPAPGSPAPHAAPTAPPTAPPPRNVAPRPTPPRVGEPPPAGAATAPVAATTQDPRKGITPFTAKLLKGNAAYLARDFAGAIAAYREAIQDDPQNPLGHYLLGEGQLAAANLAEAEASWANGLRLAGNDEPVHAKLLYAMADLRERQGKAPEAKKAWQEYGAFVGSHPQAKGFAEIAPEREKIIDKHVALANEYAPVKQRIEARVKELEAPPPDDGPQGPTKPAPKAPAPKAPAPGKKPAGPMPF
jgi:tetratricopeptide (TPR) repeat protein